MGFYVCVALIAALSVGNDDGGLSRLVVVEIVWAMTLILAFTHWFAVSIAARLVADPDDHHTPLEILGAEVSIVSLVVLAATLVVVVAPSGYERLGARVTAAVGITLIVGLELVAGGRLVGVRPRTAWLCSCADWRSRPSSGSSPSDAPRVTHSTSEIRTAAMLSLGSWSGRSSMASRPDRPDHPASIPRRSSWCLRLLRRVRT